MNSESIPYLWIFQISVLIIAFLYAAVGHGGASGYLALMALWGFQPDVMKPTALLLNLVVSGLAFLQFYRKDHFNFRLFWPFALTSVPAAFLGGTLNVNPQIYKLILGILLILAVVRMLLVPSQEKETKSMNIFWGLAIGAVIGFFSGMTGIGGGIILSPLILLMKWGSFKETAAVSALFIFVNSAAGLLGHSSGHAFQFNFILLPILAVIGAFTGSYFGSTYKNIPILKYILSIVLLIAGIKLIAL